MVKKVLVPLTILAALAVGCGGTEGETDDSPPTGTNADAPSSTTSEADEDEPSEAPANPKFGESWTWDDGLSVTISEPKPYEPSEYAAVGKGEPIRFTVTLVNNTGENFDPALTYMTLQSGNAEAEQIFDSAKGLNGSPSTKLLDGREAKFDIGFAVKDPNDLVLEFEPDAGFEYEGVIYTS